MVRVARQAKAAGIQLYAAVRDWDAFAAAPGLQTLVETQLTGLAPDSALKWDVTQPTQGAFSFVEADHFMSWADAYGVAIHWPALIEHISTPEWVAETIEPGTWAAVIDEHIAGVLGPYLPRGWDVDVVAAAFNEVDGKLGGYRDTLWHAAAGADYVPYAFERARVYNPNGRLFLAEHDIEQAGQDERRGNLLTAVEDWVSQGVPIDGINIQSQLRADLNLDKPALLGFVRGLRRLGLAVMVSELETTDLEALVDRSKPIQEFLTTAFRAGVTSVAVRGDLLASAEIASEPEQMAMMASSEVPPDVTQMSLEPALLSGFQAEILAQPDKELVIAVELLITV